MPTPSSPSTRMLSTTPTQHARRIRRKRAREKQIPASTTNSYTTARCANASTQDLMAQRVARARAASRSAVEALVHPAGTVLPGGAVATENGYTTPEEYEPATTDEDGGPICARRTKRCKSCNHRFKGKGAPDSEYHLWHCPECGQPRHCRQPVDELGQACRYHGGKSPRGLASPHFKNGKRCKHPIERLPGGIRADIKGLKNDRQRLTLINELDLSKALEQSYYGDLELGDPAALSKAIEKINEHYQSYKAARSDPALSPQQKLEAMKESLESLEAAIAQGMAARSNRDSVISKIMALQDHRRKLLDTDTKRALSTHGYIPIEDIAIEMVRTKAAIEKHVTDPRTLQAIREEIIGDDEPDEEADEYTHRSPSSMAAPDGSSLGQHRKA